jgi:hypothetical protein
MERIRQTNKTIVESRSSNPWGNSTSPLERPGPQSTGGHEDLAFFSLSFGHQDLAQSLSVDLEVATTFTNYLRLTTILGALQVTPIRLGDPNLQEK